MKLYAAVKGYIPAQDMAIFEQIATVIRNAPEISFPNEAPFRDDPLSCHLLCRALAEIFPVKVRDGYFTTGYQHSWLVPEGEESLIDAYPVAGGTPFIVATDLASPWKDLYQVSSDMDSRFAEDEFQRRLIVTHNVLSRSILRLDTT